MKIQEIKKAA
jgi:phytanoyl-CoA hydroxylase